MAKALSLQKQVEAVVARLLAEQAEGAGETIDDIENSGVEIGDLIARTIVAEKLRRRMQHPPEHPACPHCGRPGVNVGPRNRTLLTRRGEVPITEAKYRCRQCRRHFFPSDPNAGS